MSVRGGSAETIVPIELMEAVEHLRKSFDTIHFQFGWTTEQLCYWRLHGENAKLGTRNLQEHVEALPHLKQSVGTAGGQRFDRMLSRGTPPAIFKAFYDLYMDGLKVQIRLVFSGLLQIGLANGKSISLAPIEWAKRVSEKLIDDHHHKIPRWIKSVCDEQTYDPNEDMEERIFWRKWQAPNLLVMEPSRYRVYEPESAWERNDPETSLGWLDAFRDDYSLVLKIEVENLAGAAAFQQAMAPPAVEKLKEFQMSQTFNLQGPNSRVNIGSTDNSINVAHQASPFEQIRAALEQGITDASERARLQQALSDLEVSTDRESGTRRYEAFIAVAANHMTLVAPFLPSLGHWVHNFVASL
jgi:hypothetical protein